MKKLLVAVAVLGLAATANAGDYHQKETLRCSQCHTMHASRAHALNASDPVGTWELPDAGNPHRKLLISNGTNETCLACHDASAAFPDVLGPNAFAATANVRSAGALNGTVGSHLSGAYADWMGHTLGSGAPPPGFVGIYEPTPLENFNCANCHAVHGSGAYRNLGLSSYMGLEGMAFDATNPFTAVGPTYNALPAAGIGRVIAFDAGKDATILVDGRNYETKNVAFGTGSANTTAKNGMNAYCAVCHGNFHGDANTRDQIGGVDFVRHPTSAVVRTNNPGTLLNGVLGTDLVRPSWTGTPGATVNFEAACLSCHKGHGNARGYGLIYPSLTGINTDYENGNGLPDPDGAYPLRNLCNTCHDQGR